MSFIDDREALINELARFHALTDNETGLIRVARGNAFHLRQTIGLEERKEANVIFNELGFRLDRIKRRIAGRNIHVFNPRKMQARGPRMAKVRMYG